MVKKAKATYQKQLKQKQAITEPTIKKDTEVQTPANTPVAAPENKPSTTPPPLVTPAPKSVKGKQSENQSCILGMFCSSANNVKNGFSILSLMLVLIVNLLG